MKLITRTHDVDVVIPTRDRPEQLVGTLQALARQSITNFRVIVVDDGSRCDVESVIPQALRDSLAVRFVRNDVSLGAGRARDRGVAQSEAPYVVFIDDDCVAGPNLIARHYQALASVDEPVVSLGPILSVPGRRLPAWSHWDAYQLEREYANLAGRRVDPGWGHLFTGNVGLRRRDFRAVGGFDDRFQRGEDIELGYRLDRYGCRFVFDSEAVVWHDSQRSLRTWLRIASSAALSDIEMHERDPEANRLAMVAEELRSRHWATRLARRVFGGNPIAARCAVVAAVGAGLLLHTCRAERLSLSAISVARDLTYWRALQEALPQHAQPFRSASIGVA